MQNVFGQLFSKFKSIMKRDSKTSTKPSSKIWNVTDGPYQVNEVPGDIECPEGFEWFLIGLIEEDGEIHEAYLWYETLDDAYEIVKHFKSSVYPLELEGEVE